MRYSKAKLLAYAKEQCKLHNVKFCQHDSAYAVCDGYPVAGWFDSDSKPPELHISMQRKDWDTVLSHELSHLHQWAESNLTKKRMAWNVYDRLDLNLDHWTSGTVNYTKAQVNKILKATVDMERDCEVRSLKLLESFGYKKSSEYKQKGNAYTLFYYFYVENKCWSKPGKSPYNQKAIWSKFPDTWDIDQKTTYKALKHLYLLCL